MLPYDDEATYTDFPDPGIILKIMDLDFMEIPDVNLPEGMEVPSISQDTPAMAGAAPAAPAVPAVGELMPIPEPAAEAEPVIEAEPAPVAAPAPRAPKPPAGVGASDGLSQLTQTQRGSEDTRADALFEE